MILKFGSLAVALAILCCCDNANSFGVNQKPSRIWRRGTDTGGSFSTTALLSSEAPSEKEKSIWENLAMNLYSDYDLSNNFEKMKSYTNTISLFRVGIPSLFIAASAKISYPFVAIALANAIDDSGVFAVVSQDASQYIQNILTTSGLTFSILVGQTYYFMYQVSQSTNRISKSDVHLRNIWIPYFSPIYYYHNDRMVHYIQFLL